MSYNEAFIEILQQLEIIMNNKGEKFRARAYQKAKESILAYKKPILYVNEIKNLPGIGKTIIEKLEQYVSSGKVDLIETEKQSPLHIFTQIYGVGPKKAEELISHGINTIAQLRNQQELLNDKQKIGLYYYEDLLKPIPRDEIDKYKALFHNTLNETADKCNIDRKEIIYEIAGSYRRGKQQSGDIDVIMSCQNEEIFEIFIKTLEIKQNIIILSHGKHKCLVIAKLDNIHSARRVDFLFAKPAEYAFSLLYFTGSKTFNTEMRNHALILGYTMNEHGIYTTKKKEEVVWKTIPTEKDIFAFLGWEYVSPELRYK
jgi:DNA polymerase/3'-5' exonuclease PolX